MEAKKSARAMKSGRISVKTKSESDTRYEMNSEVRTGCSCMIECVKGRDTNVKMKTKEYAIVRRVIVQTEERSNRQ